MADILHIIGDKNLLKFLCLLSEEKNSYNMIFFILTIRPYNLFNIFNVSSFRMHEYNALPVFDDLKQWMQVFSSVYKGLICSQYQVTACSTTPIGIVVFIGSAC